VALSFGLSGYPVDLWRGITGFRDVDDPTLPSTDFKKFGEHCYAAARSLGGKVRMLQPPGAKVNTNFAQAILETRSGAIAILLNAHFPIVAFAEPIEFGEMRVCFVDAAPLAEIFRGFDVKEVLTLSQARKRVMSDDCLQAKPSRATTSALLAAWHARRYCLQLLGLRARPNPPLHPGMSDGTFSPYWE
jgi:hypothetical protein